MSETDRSERPATRRPLAGLAVGIVALLVLGYPILVTALLATFSFTGCFLECSARQPGRGVAWSAVTALLLAVPVGLGLAVARVRSRAAWLAAGGVVVVVVLGWAVLSVLG
jgi:drug/metabolite transporter superfamily protein YnfA